MATLSTVDKLQMSLEEIQELKKKEQQEKRKEAAAKRAAEKKVAAEKKKTSTTPSSAKQKEETPSNTAKTAAEKPPIVLGTPVIVGNVDPEADLEQIKDVFESCGPIKSISKMKFNGKWHAIRLVYKNKADAEKAIQEFHERMMDDRKLRVVLQKDRPARKGKKPGKNQTKKPATSSS